MRTKYSTQNRIVDQSQYDDSGNLIAQQVFEISTRRGAQNIHRIVKQIIRYKNKDQGFKELVCAEVSAIIPDLAESEVLLNHLVVDIREHLSVYDKPKQIEIENEIKGVPAEASPISAVV